MSQIIKPLTSSGPIPPIIPTSFTVDITDDTTVVGVPPVGGTVVPQANILRVTGDNGINTVASTAFPGVMIIYFTRGEVTTVGATTSACLTYPINTDSALTMQLIVIGRDTTTGDAVGGYSTCTVKNVAGVVSVIGTPDIIVNRGTTFANTVTFTVSGSGSNFVVNVTGEAGKTIKWTAALPGIVSD